MPMRMLTEADRAALAMYCQAYSRWVEAETLLREKGTVVKSPSGSAMLNPYLSVANKAMEQMKGFLSEFGMTPASRARIQLPPEEGPEDEFSKLVG